MNEPNGGAAADRVAQIIRTWNEVEPRIARLSRGPTRIDFFHRLLSEYRVATLYAKTACAGGVAAYGRDLQNEGLRTMAFDTIAGAAEYVVGAHLETTPLTMPELREISERTSELIERAIAQFHSGGSSWLGSDPLHRGAL